MVLYLYRSNFSFLLMESLSYFLTSFLMFCLRCSPIRSDFETLSFQTQEPGPENKPQRPFGTAGCSDFHCSPKLLQFVKATNVKISFYQHLLVTNRLHKYFGVRRILVSGTYVLSCFNFLFNLKQNSFYIIQEFTK